MKTLDIVQKSLLADGKILKVLKGEDLGYTVAEILKETEIRETPLICRLNFLRRQGVIESYLPQYHLKVWGLKEKIAELKAIVEKNKNE